ncbi:TetR/AcrR family transcriptional regulator [Paenibacillus sp. J5C_2022]|uniref:TetR/AcrR family transcriptional regulator n=1 Tax=Paenibacillus sp. J5C2022 TaxID=2977129 RepID=UPI0021D14DB8|nr:TetR/AcrR family transcriptional regulator [Paenibacillus sp. J5C2022]MCU6707477.1 TetR/AcrR family transcriptional regulator [Paenibacillus sp. J5C2022]
MKPQERYKQEREEQKKQRSQHILQAAEKVFFRKGMEFTTMNDIAEEANIGVATVFRHFPNKESLMASIASHMMGEILDSFQRIADRPVPCLEKIGELFDYFITLLEENRSSFIKFMEDLHLNVSHSGQANGMLEDSETVGRQIFEVFGSIIEQGESDGSLRSDLETREVLLTVVNAFGLFSSKLSYQKNVLLLPTDVEPERQLAIMKTIILAYLKA